MRATYGFHATMTARPGKGDELVDVLLSATSDMGPATSENCVLFLVGRSASNKDVVHVTEGWTTKDAHAEMFASEAARAHLAKVLLGHGPIPEDPKHTRAALDRARQILVDARDGIQNEIARGATEEQAVAAVKLQQYEKLPSFAGQRQVVLRRIYRELKGTLQ